jgi:F-type H+-transporting ATPase subunit b
MPINWFTVVAQAINFLLLVWLLKRFLYKPILDAIDAREKGIAAKLAEADAKKAEAQKDRDEFQQKNDVFDKERAALVKTATDSANAERQRLLNEARKDSDALRAKRQEALENEQRHLSQEIICWTQQEVFAMARKTLADLANLSLEAQIGEIFIERLHSLTEPDKEQLMIAAKANAQSVHVRSAFELPVERRNAIETAVKQSISTEAQIQFETVLNLVSGIELSANGQKVAWSITDYLTALEKTTGELLQSNQNKSLDSATDTKAKAVTPPEKDLGPKPAVVSEQGPATHEKQEPVPAVTRTDH